MVIGDHDRLLQTVTNLVDDALEATGGTGSLTLHVGPQTLDVVDDGPGVPDADRVRTSGSASRAGSSPIRGVTSGVNHQMPGYGAHDPATAGTVPDLVPVPRPSLGAPA